MASGDERASTPDLDATDLRIGVIGTRWNADIVARLRDGAMRGLDAYGVRDVVELSVPGAYELPLAAQFLAQSGIVDGIVVIGAVIRGDTTHYELVAGECGRAIMDVQLATNTGIGMGVLTVENADQALVRSEGPGGHNVGEEATTVAVEMAILKRTFPATHVPKDYQ